MISAKSHLHQFNMNLRHFRIEVQDIVATQNAACACAEYVANDLILKNVKRFDYNKGFDESLAELKCPKYTRPMEMKREMRDTLARALFVRLISALEVFLTNHVSAAFILNRKLFMANNISYEYSQAELLSWHSISAIRTRIIGKICRDLTSNGYLKIVDFYKKTFDVNLDSILPGKEKISDYHEHRHLLVHRLGQTDSSFRKKFSTKKRGIHIDEDYLFQAALDLNGFAKEVTKQICKKFETNSSKTDRIDKPIPERIVTIEITFEAEGCEIASPEFDFMVNDEYCLLADLITEYSKQDNGSKKRLTIAGTFNQIRKYMSIVAKYVKKKNFACSILSDVSSSMRMQLKPEGNRPATESDRLYEISKKKRKMAKLRATITQDMVDSIKDQLPPQPWDKGIHKLVANRLGLKPKIVTSAISLLIKNGDFKNQIDGSII